jgi:hypothetical protein
MLEVQPAGALEKGLSNKKKVDATVFGAVFEENKNLFGGAKQPRFERLAAIDTAAADHVFNDESYFSQLNDSFIASLSLVVARSIIFGVSAMLCWMFKRISGSY